jgi:RimJ/RimL family protein N-acetyltransferase
MDPYVLNDGTAVEIRSIEPADAKRLQAAHARLSPESRYRRFLGAKPVLSAEEAHYLAEIDGCDHFALVATAPAGDDEHSIIAVARFVALEDDPGAAEFAIVVGDSCQRQGLATELLTRLTAAAAARGVSRLRATILSDNAAIYKLMQRVAPGEVRVTQRGSISDVEFELRAAGDRDLAAEPGDPADRRSQPGPRLKRLRSSRRGLEADSPVRTTR